MDGRGFGAARRGRADRGVEQRRVEVDDAAVVVALSPCHG
jgi:hypothetical protein